MSDQEDARTIAVTRQSGLLRAQPLAGQIYEELLQDIAMGRFIDGERLPTEAQLCERFSVSRPVLREALTRLKAEGIIVARQGSGSIVRKSREIRLQADASMDLSDIVRGLEYRLALETEAAALAAKRRTERDLREIETGMMEFERVISERKVGVSSDFRFHLAIAIASHNDLFVSSLWRVHREIGHELTLLNHASKKTPQRKMEVSQEHIGLVEAIRSGKSDLAASIMRQHIGVSLERIRGLAQKQVAIKKPTEI
jgi:DNA-binding FadR family transcriptional regulator